MSGIDDIRGGSASARAQVADMLQRARHDIQTAGFTEADGLGPIRVDIQPDISEASYVRAGERGPERILFGSAPRNGTPLYADRDVVVHEFAHRIFATLNPQADHRSAEGGGIDEAFADIVAVATDDDWVLGEDSTPIRALDDPGNPAYAVRLNGGGRREIATHIDDVADEWLGREARYVNTGIVEKAAHAIGSVLGKPMLLDLFVQGVRELGPQPRMEDLADAVARAAAGHGDDVASAVEQAWAAVGLDAEARASRRDTTGDPSDW